MSEVRKSWVPTFFLWLGVVVCVGIIAAIWPDRTYYFLPMADRPLYPHHEFLRPSGIGGLSFGIAGTILMFLNLTYLLRKQLIRLAWLGALRSWMAFHVFTGLLGGALVLFHSALQPHSALGILGFISVWIVVMTGLIGRYIYAHSPRSLEGRELELDEIYRRLESVRAQLEKFGVAKNYLTISSSDIPTRQTERSLIKAFFGLIAGDREIHREFSQLQSIVTRTPLLKNQASQILPLAKRYYTERQWLIRYYELRSFMSRWRFLHRWFAIIVLVMAVFHIIVSIRLGDLWFLRNGS